MGINGIEVEFDKSDVFDWIKWISNISLLIVYFCSILK